MLSDATGTENPEPVPPIEAAGAVSTVVVSLKPTPGEVILTDETAPPAFTTIVAVGYVVADDPLERVITTPVYVPVVYREPPVIEPSVATLVVLERREETPFAVL